MKNVYHILNGDALKMQFPKDIRGEFIIARECLVDGNVKGESLEALFKTRANFISSNYIGYSEQDYYDKTATELIKIKKTPIGSEVNLWFEDDLFCQVNLWFILHLLFQNTNAKHSIYLVRPDKHTQYGFAGYDNTGLENLLKTRIHIDSYDLRILSNLWKFYQHNMLGELLVIGEQLMEKYPFIMPAIQAHRDRIPKGSNPGRPIRALIEIMKELDTTDFAAVFKLFSERESIYGFGDLQVKRLFDDIIYSRAD